MKDDFIDKFPDAAQEFVSLLIETEEYIENDKKRVAYTFKMGLKK